MSALHTRLSYSFQIQQRTVTQKVLPLPLHQDTTAFIIHQDQQYIRLLIFSWLKRAGVCVRTRACTDVCFIPSEHICFSLYGKLHPRVQCPAEMRPCSEGREDTEHMCHQTSL